MNALNPMVNDTNQAYRRLSITDTGTIIAVPIMTKHINQIRFLATVRLTPVGAEYPNGIDVSVTELITYSQQPGFTRLQLKGQKTLDVVETTERIDSLIRNASPS